MEAFTFGEKLLVQPWVSAKELTIRNGREINTARRLHLIM